MIGDNLTFLLAHDTVFLLFSHKHLLHRIEQVLLIHILSSCLDGIDRRLIDHIRQIRSNRSRSRQRDLIQIHGIIHPHILGMHLQDFHSSLQIRLIYDNSSIKTSRTKKSLIQNLRPVGSRKNNNTFLAVKTIHFRQQLIQRLLSLLVPATVFGIPAPTDGIYLVNEHDTWSVFLCFLEQITHAGSAHTHI